MKRTLLLTTLAIFPTFAAAWVYEHPPADPYFAKYEPFKAPQPAGLLLKKGDKLAICGDSITEQKMYSLLMEGEQRATPIIEEVAVNELAAAGE